MKQMEQKEQTAQTAQTAPAMPKDQAAQTVGIEGLKHTQPQALAFFEEADLRGRLDGVYGEVPEGRCAGCTRCCMESVNTFACEYLNVRKQLAAQGELEPFAKAAVRYYLTELVRPMACPLLRADGRCSVYAARPLPCRVFGHLERSDYEENYEAILAGNREAALALKAALGIEVPKAVYAKKIAFCEDFAADRRLSAEERDDLVDALFGLDSLLLSRGLLDFDDVNLSLVQWFAYDALGRENAEALRVKIAQQLSRGEGEALLEEVLAGLFG